MEMNVHYVTDNQFTNYSDNSVTVNRKEYKTNIIVTNNEVHDFDIKNISDIKVEDLSIVLEFKPDLVIFGTGVRVIYPDIKIIQFLQKNNIGYEVMSVQALCRTYNFLVSENRKIACFLLF
jgi:uncharacterized protein